MWMFIFQLLSRDERNLFFDDDEDEMEMQVNVKALCFRLFCIFNSPLEKNAQFKFFKSNSIPRKQIFSENAITSEAHVNDYDICK